MKWKVENSGMELGTCPRFSDVSDPCQGGNINDFPTGNSLTCSSDDCPLFQQPANAADAARSYSGIQDVRGEVDTDFRTGGKHEDMYGYPINQFGNDL